MLMVERCANATWLARHHRVRITITLNSAVDLTAKNAKSTKKDSHEWIHKSALHPAGESVLWLGIITSSFLCVLCG
jgi:hypothetical protein